jgi:excisionase family DNA binding protein
LREGKRTIEEIRAEIPIPERLTLTAKEAAAYSNIGVNKIDEMLRMPNCPFALFIGTKKLVKRQEFEDFIRQKLVI